jgi:hypothetical protein
VTGTRRRKCGPGRSYPGFREKRPLMSSTLVGGASGSGQGIVVGLCGTCCQRLGQFGHRRADRPPLTGVRYRCGKCCTHELLCPATYFGPMCQLWHHSDLSCASCATAARWHNWHKRPTHDPESTLEGAVANGVSETPRCPHTPFSLFSVARSSPARKATSPLRGYTKRRPLR